MSKFTAAEARVVATFLENREDDSIAESAAEMLRAFATLRKDAERYRWLRDEADAMTLHEVIPDMVMTDPKKTDDNFDAAIDAGRAG